MIETIIFDLDGTLLPMNEERFQKAYFSLLYKKAESLGYDGDDMVKAVLSSTAAVLKNDGKETNESVFWKSFCEIYGSKAYNDKPLFEEFYGNEFNLARSSCGYDERASMTVDELRRRGYTLILATNPVFPRSAILARLKWAGVDASAFKRITTYENSSWCKPKIGYYEEILEKENLDGKKCMMIGNDAEEDMIATTIVSKGFLLTDYLINRKNIDITRMPHGGYPALWRFLDDTLAGGFEITKED